MTIREFKANALFVHTTNKNTIYNHVCEGIVNSALDGIDGVVIAVGQQCSGKTYNMIGTFTDNEGSVNIRNRGIAPRLLDEMFKRSHSSSPDKKISIKISCVETRDNCVNDLLEPTNPIPHSLKKLLVKQKITNYRDGLTKLFEAESRKQMDKSVNYLGANVNDFIFTIYVTVYDTVKQKKKSSKIHVIDTGGIQRARSSLNAYTSCTANKMKLSLNTLFLRLAEAKHSERLETALKASKHLLICHIRPESSYLELSLSTLSLATSLRMMPPLSIPSYAPSDDIELLQTYVDRLEEEFEHTDSTDFLVSPADVQKYKKVKNVINFFSDSEPIPHDSLPEWLPPIAYSIVREELRLVMKGTETKFNEQFKIIARQQIKDNAFGDVDVEKNYENWLKETEVIINKVDKLNGTVDEILLVDKLPIIDTQEWSRFLKRNGSIFEDARYKKHKLERAQ
ncbi:kinesin-like protein KIF9 [Adelges cooleyi]|uniref:kinesin-like protein KIF9 n=1 Tax=Adelges cooleyi TaxID=133065 RepID=UPI00217F6C36|nr:kinesin-like protein KIF9 [Adelges cooleyi]